MIGAILIKEVNEFACEEWRWVALRVVSFCNLDVTKVAESGSGVRDRTIGSIAGDEEVSDSNIITN